MAYEQGLKPLKQIQLSTLSPVMWSLKGGYPRKAMTVPIARESALGGYEDGLRPLNQVHLSRLSPVMWSTKYGYPRKQMSVPIGRGMGIDWEGAGGGTLLLLAIPLAMFLGIAGIGVLSNVVNGREPFGY